MPRIQVVERSDHYFEDVYELGVHGEKRHLKSTCESLEVYPDYEREGSKPVHLPNTIRLHFSKQILVEAFFSCIREMQLVRAVNLLDISSDILTAIYKAIFGPVVGKLSAVEQHRRIRKTLELVLEVCDNYWCTEASLLEFGEHFILQLPVESLYDMLTLDLHPWNTGENLLMRANRPPGILGVDSYRTIQTGEFIGDICYLSGKWNDKTRCWHANFCRLPGIFMEFSIKHELHPRAEYYTRYQSFRGFAHLLRLVFGPDTGIFMRVFSPEDDYVFVEL